MSGLWTILAPARANRPMPVGAGEDERAHCPFCENYEELTPPEVEAIRDGGAVDGPGWSVRVIPNKYPAVMPALALGPGAPSPESGSIPAIGRHEVVVEAPEHVSTITGKSAEHWGAVFQTYRTRLRALREDPSVRFALVFKNAGWRAGASQEHAHSQILGIPMIPPMIVEELASCQQHYQETGRYLFSDLLSHAQIDGECIAGETEHFLALCPYASRFPCEVWILPKRPVPSFADHPLEQFVELGGFARSLLIALERLLPEPAYNYFLHTAPFDGLEHQYYHWHLEVTPRVVGLAGFELGSGMNINPIPPEWAARQLRRALKSMGTQ